MAQRIKLGLIGCLLCFVLLAAGGGSIGGYAQSHDAAGARAAFLEAYKVFAHPRCVNCHPAGDAPLQGDDGHPHAFRVRRGEDGRGVFAAKCSNCHQTQNQSGEHAAPGAPYPPEDREHLSEPRWHLPSSATPLTFEKRSPAQLCRQLLNRKQNGGLAPEQLVHHVSHDPLVLWGWNPGGGRSTPPLSHEDFVQKSREWVEKGCACPK